MIELTSINGNKFCLNSDLIYKIEELPDTIVTLTNGKVLRVQDTMKDIIEKTVDYRRRIFLSSLEGDR